MVSFANAKGGKLLIGVEDDGTVYGHDLTNDEKSNIEGVARGCDPPVYVEIESVQMTDDKWVTVVHVPKSDNAPHRSTAGYFLRVSASSVKMSTQQLTDYLNEYGRLGFDEYVHQGLVWSDVFKEDKINRYKTYLPSSAQGISTEHLLKTLDCVKDGNATNTGLILFTETQEFLPQFMVRAVAYGGNDKGSDILDQKDFGDDIFNVIEGSVQFILRHINQGIKIEGLKSQRLPELPEVALREAVVNAVVHRDYNIKGAHVMIEVFLDRVEISSPGSLPAGMEMEDLGKRSLARNGILASVMSRTPYMEKLGTGIRRIEDAMVSADLSKAAFENSGFFTVVMYRPIKEAPQVTPQVTPHVTPHDTPHDTPQITPQVKGLLKSLVGEMNRVELMKKLTLSDRKNFGKTYLHPALKQGLIQMTIPDKPRSRNQKYKLTPLGLQVKREIK